MPTPSTATRGSRLLAKIVDMVPQLIVQAAFSVPILASVQMFMANTQVQKALQTAQNTPPQLPPSVVSAFVTQITTYSLSASGILLVYWIIQAVILTKDGQTIGKKLFKIRVVNEKDGRNGGFVPNVLLRAILNAVFSLIPFYALIDILFIFRGDKRCIHDLLAGTVVVKA